MKNFLIGFVSLFVFIVCWNFSDHTSWSSTSGIAESYPLEPSYAVQDVQLSTKCTGFTGHCEFPQYGLKLHLDFSGIKIKKPSYRMSFLGGGNDGFYWGNYYFGTRKLKITFEKTGKIVLIEQFVWNFSAVQDFVDIVHFRSAKNELYIATDYVLPSLKTYKFKLDVLSN